MGKESNFQTGLNLCSHDSKLGEALQRDWFVHAQIFFAPSLIFNLYLDLEKDQVYILSIFLQTQAFF